MSDVHADGMWLEAWDRKQGEPPVMTAFDSDADGSTTFEEDREGLPPDFVVWFRSQAWRRLPPVSA